MTSCLRKKRRLEGECLGI
ncbi:hypothetical protein MTR67_003697 [Solanum verrucosum]|uniref:Uncharacterized protein n=1 Tax=Solanum verrucosum TaxID=315347 RepID=A0AAF0T744_SOLVR|nr:hypothetical protein MTR67_003697 [Solanum verrucosum]